MFDQQQQQAGNDLLMSEGEGGPKAWSWSVKDQMGRYQPKPYGTSITGTVTKVPEVAQQRNFDTGNLEVWADGNPKLKIIITLQTTLKDDEEDDGIRTLHVKKGWAEHQPIREAVLASGAEKMEVGGKLTVVFVGETPNPGGGFPTKNFTATYQPPAQSALMDSPTAQQPATPAEVRSFAQTAQQPVQQPVPALPQPANDPTVLINTLAQAGKTAEEIAPLVGLTPDAVRGFIAAF